MQRPQLKRETSPGFPRPRGLNHSPIQASPNRSPLLKNALDMRKRSLTPERSVSPSLVMSRGNEFDWETGEGGGRPNHSASLARNQGENPAKSLQISPVIKDYLLLEEIGQGSFGKVFKAEYLPTKTPVAVKVYPKSTLTRTREASIKNEINILVNLDHPNIVKFIDCFSNKEHIFIVMELLEGENLYKSFKKGLADFAVDFSRPEARQRFAGVVMTQLSSALLYLHERFINHRDVKLDNIAFDSKTAQIKLIDFGFSKVVSPYVPERLYCGTPSYMAPEALRKEECNTLSVDIWAAGVVYYTLLFGKFPFRGSTDIELFENIMTKKLFFPEWLEESEVHVLKKCLDKRPNNRVTAAELYRLMKYNQY